MDAMWISFVPADEADGPLPESYDRQARALGEPDRDDARRLTAPAARRRPPRPVRGDRTLPVDADRAPAQPHLVRHLGDQRHAALHEPGDHQARARPASRDDRSYAARADHTSLELPAADRAVVDYTAKLTSDAGDDHA